MVDIDALLRSVDLVKLAEDAGAQFNAKLSSKCPLHGGDNPTAFHIYVDARGVQRWKCFTNCPEGQNGGDALSFWQAWKKVEFKTAVQELAAWSGDPSLQTPQNNEGRARDERLPAPEAAPSAVWIARAKAFAEWASEQLWSERGSIARTYLHARGLLDSTIGEARLGWNPSLLKDSAERWFGTAGDPIWLHAGITIPHLVDDTVQGVKIRCFRDGKPVTEAGKKYRGPRGGRMSLYGAEHWRGYPVGLLVEGEFDAMIVRQEAGDLVDVATLAGAKANLSVEDMLTLLSKAVIVAVYDADDAGKRGGAALTARWSRAVQVSPPDHDLTDYYLHGGNLRQWIAETVAPKYETILERVDSNRDLELYLRWLDVYGKCLEAGAAETAETPYVREDLRK